MGDIIIRTAVPEDLAALKNIEDSCFQSPWSLAMIEEELLNDSARFYIAEEDGAALASLSCWLIPPYECQIGNVATLPKARRRGLAGALIKRLMSDCRELSIEEMYLEVRRSNLPAVKLYEGLGFSGIGERKAYYEDGEDAVLMQVTLK